MPGGVAVFGPEVQPGETQLAYLERRTTELKFQGRPVILARYEAEAEYRRYAAMAISGSLPSQAIEQPTPGPTSCSQCGTVKRSPGPCPDCGAPA
jgi:rubrerythrin